MLGAGVGFSIVRAVVISGAADGGPASCWTVTSTFIILAFSLQCFLARLVGLVVSLVKVVSNFRAVAMLFYHLACEAGID